MREFDYLFIVGMSRGGVDITTEALRTPRNARQCICISSVFSVSQWFYFVLGERRACPQAWNALCSQSSIPDIGKVQRGEKSGIRLEPATASIDFFMRRSGRF